VGTKQQSGWTERREKRKKRQQKCKWGQRKVSIRFKKNVLLRQIENNKNTLKYINLDGVQQEIWLLGECLAGASSC